MKKVLGIVVSNRKRGNCEIMAKEISRRVADPHELQLLRLTDFNIKYCKGCYRCLFDEKRCVQKDDLELILEAITEADALILVVPTYVMGAHSCLKTFLDRALCFYGKADKLWGKPAVGIGVAGIDGKEGSTLLDIERFHSILMTNNQYTKIVYGAFPGEVVSRHDNIGIASDAAAALFGTQSTLRGELSCVVCGGQTFRFLDENNVRCMLCSESGKLAMQNGQFVLTIDTSGHQLTGETAWRKHLDWLKEMRQRFEEYKECLKEIGSSYEGEGKWIKPNISNMI